MPDEPEDIFVNPYNFSRLPKVRARSEWSEGHSSAVSTNKYGLPTHDRYHPELESGVIRVSITNLTALHIASRGDKADNSPFLKSDDGSRLLIPGSGVRGLVRSVSEILAAGCIGRIADQELTHRPGTITGMDPAILVWLVRRPGAQGASYEVYSPQEIEEFQVGEAETGSHLRDGASCGNPEGVYYIARYLDPRRYSHRRVSFAVSGRPLLPAASTDLERLIALSDGVHKAAGWPQVGPGGNRTNGDGSIGRARKLIGQMLDDCEDETWRGLFAANGWEIPEGEPKPAVALCWARLQGGRVVGLDPTARPRRWRKRRVLTIHDDGEKKKAETEGRPTEGLLPEQFETCVTRATDDAKLWCPVCALFGPSEAADATTERSGRRDPRMFAGRVNFSEFATAPKPEGFALKTVRRRAMGTPKPTFEAFYLTDDRHYGVTSTWDSESEGAILRGRKLYRHQPWVSTGNEVTATEAELIRDTQRRAQGQVTFNPEIEVLAAGPNRAETFQGEVRYNNLTRRELGLLILALDVSRLGRAIADGYDGETRAMIGSGRPLGMGSVKVELSVFKTSAAGRLATLGKAPITELDPSELDDLTTEFASWALECQYQGHDSSPLEHFVELSHVKDLVSIWRFNEYEQPDGRTFAYPPPNRYRQLEARHLPPAVS